MNTSTSIAFKDWPQELRQVNAAIMSVSAQLNLSSFSPNCFGCSLFSVDSFI
jgi:hypothetical protein